MDVAKKDLRFDKRAAKYDGFEGRVSRRFYGLLLEQVKLFPDITVLDVGCGTGLFLRKMADICPINGYGIDMSENMAVEARKKCPEMHIKVSRCESTPFEDQAFDVITTCMAYHHFADQKGFAKEAARILKPGGRLYIADPRFSALVRKPLNGAFNLLRIAGYIGTAQEIADNFSEYGFESDSFAFDGYAQVVTLKLAGKS